MAAYAMFNIDIFDPETYEQYRSQDGPTIEKYGGKFIVRGGASEKIEGEWDPRRMVILEFESMERARQWYQSPEYRGVVKFRHQSARTDVIFMEGV